MMLFLFAIATSSCSKQESATLPTEQNSSSLLIKVTGEDANASTKTTLDGLITEWVEGDKVGIFAYGAKLTPDDDIDSEIYNAPFTANTSGKSSSFAGTMYWGEGQEEDEDEFYHYFYSYYPYNSEVSIDPNLYYGIPISIPHEQNQTGVNSTTHIGALDFMVATPIIINSSLVTQSEPVVINFKYNHVFTMLEFKIKGSGKLTKVRLSGPVTSTLAFSGGYIYPDGDNDVPLPGDPYNIDLTTTPAVLYNIVEVTTVETTLSDVSTSVYMMINPSDETENYEIGLYIDGVWKFISKTAPSAGFKRGNKYTVQVNSEDAKIVLEVGDLYGGGVVAYILQPDEFNGVNSYDPDVQHGFIAATEDQSTGVNWGTYDFITTSTELGTGLANTQTIVGIQAPSIFAAGIASAYRGGGYEDWFLPSIAELEKLRINKVAIGGFDITGNSYWSSSQGPYYGQSYFLGFDNIYPRDGVDRNTLKRIRAIRPF